MLIKFIVKNHRSIRDEQMFSTVALKPKSKTKLLENNFFTSPFSKSIKLAKTSAMFGTNAAGKSNFIDALEFMRHIVLNSNRFQTGDSLPTPPFLFDDNSKNSDSEYEVEFVQRGIRYQFGFTCNANTITEEWVLAWPKGSQQLWYERFYGEDNKEDYKFGPNFKGSKKLWRESTGPSTLFLSRAAEHNSEQLKPVIEWFKKLIILGHRKEFSFTMTADYCEEPKNKVKVIDFFKKFDLPIQDINITEEKIDTNVQKEVRSFLDRLTPDPASIPPLPEKAKRVNISHVNRKTGKKYTLPLDLESEGTKKMFSYAQPILDALQTGRVFIIDEMSNSFHTNLSKAIVHLFNSGENKANAQLIFTTHDTSMLNPKLLRRDQIWFIDKDDEEASYLTPLTDYKPRGEEALEKNYLAGKYGAVPFIFGESDA